MSLVEDEVYSIAERYARRHGLSIRRTRADEGNSYKDLARHQVVFSPHDVISCLERASRILDVDREAVVEVTEGIVDHEEMHDEIDEDTEADLVEECERALRSAGLSEEEVERFTYHVIGMGADMYVMRKTTENRPAYRRVNQVWSLITAVEGLPQVVELNPPWAPAEYLKALLLTAGLISMGGEGVVRALQGLADPRLVEEARRMAEELSKAESQEESIRKAIRLASQSLSRMIREQREEGL